MFVNQLSVVAFSFDESSSGRIDISITGEFVFSAAPVEMCSVFLV